MNVSESIKAFADAQNAFNDADDAAVDAIVKEVADLNAKIVELQNSPGTLTPADQATLDALQARGRSISDKLTALSATTPPAPPVA